jgi:hypothetical protein
LEDQTYQDAKNEIPIEGRVKSVTDPDEITETAQTFNITYFAQVHGCLLTIIQV